MTVITRTSEEFVQDMRRNGRRTSRMRPRFSTKAAALAALVSTSTLASPAGSAASLAPPPLESALPLSPATTAAPMMVADPISVAASVFSIASSLNSLFGGGSSRRDRRTQAKLNTIIEQNNQILATLSDMAILLNNMGVTIRQNVRLELVFDKQSALMGKARQVYEVWLAEIEDHRATRPALQRYRHDLLPGVRDLRGQLMQVENYGFAPVDTVGSAMLMEFWMSRRLGENRAYRRQLGTTYVSYFARALDPAVAGSPGKALAEAVAQRDRMKAILDAADARIGPQGWTAEISRGTRHRQRGRRTDYTEYRNMQVATGNQSSGYSVRHYEEILREWSVVEGGDGPTCGVCSLISSAMNELSPDPVDSGDPTPAGRVSYWNAVRSTYVAAAREAATLAQVAATLRLYLDQAEAVRVSG